MRRKLTDIGSYSDVSLYHIQTAHGLQFYAFCKTYGIRHLLSDRRGIYHM